MQIGIGCVLRVKILAGERSNSAGERSNSAGPQSNSAGERSNSAGERSNFAGERGNSAGERSNFAGERGNSAGERSDLCVYSAAVAGMAKVLVALLDALVHNDYPSNEYSPMEIVSSLLGIQSLSDSAENTCVHFFERYHSMPSVQLHPPIRCSNAYG